MVTCIFTRAKFYRTGEKTGFSWSYFSSICRESRIKDRRLKWHSVLRCRSQSSVSWAGRGRRWRDCVRSSRCCRSDAVTANTDQHRAPCPPQTASLGTTETHVQSLVLQCPLWTMSNNIHTTLTWTTREGLTVSSLFYLMTIIFKKYTDSMKNYVFTLLKKMWAVQVYTISL